MYEKYEDVARNNTEVYRIINLVFMAIELVVVLIISIFIYRAFGINRIFNFIGITVLIILFIHGMLSIFLKIYENTLISTFLQNDIREAILDSCKIQVSTMKKLDTLTRELE